MKRLIPLLTALCLFLSACAFRAEGVVRSAQPEKTEPPTAFAPVPATPEPTYPDDGVFTLRYLPGGSLNPFACGTETNRLLCPLLFETLVSVSPAFAAEPGLCTSWTTEDGGVTFELALREGVRFSDGSDLSVWDVVYSINRARESTSDFAGRLASIRDVSVEGSGVRIVLSAANPSFPLRLDIPVVKEGTAYQSLPVGTGPYVLSEDENGRCLTANRCYDGAEALPFDCIRLADIPAEDVGAAFASSALDLLVSEPGVMNQLNDAGAVRRSVPTTVLYYLGVNTSADALAAADRRRLINSAIDRADQSAILGGETAYTLFHPGLAEDDEAAAKAWTATDIGEYCIEILTEDYDGDGMLEYFRDGIPVDFGFKLTVCSENEAATAAARSLVDDWKRQGIPVTLRLLNETAFRKAVASRDYEVYLASIRLTSDFDLTHLCTDLGDDMLRTLAENVRASEGAARLASASELCSYCAETCRIIPLVFLRRVIYTRQGAVRQSEPTWTDPFHSLTSWEVGNSTTEG